MSESGHERKREEDEEVRKHAEWRQARARLRQPRHGDLVGVRTAASEESLALMWCVSGCTSLRGSVWGLQGCYGSAWGLQGYLAHKKMPTPLGPL